MVGPVGGWYTAGPFVSAEFAQVDVAAMANAQCQHGERLVDELGQDAVVAHSVAPDSGMVCRQSLPR